MHKFVYWINTVSTKLNKPKPLTKDSSPCYDIEVCGCGGIGERWERRLRRMKRPERVAAVDKIEDQRKPEDFIGHRNRETHWIPDNDPEKRNMRMWWNW